MTKVLKRRKKQKPIVITPGIEPIPENSITTTPPIPVSVEVFTDNKPSETANTIIPIVEKVTENKESTVEEVIFTEIERFDQPKELDIEEPVSLTEQYIPELITQQQIIPTIEKTEEILPLIKGAWSGTKVWGNITTTTWRKCYSPYRVVENITVAAGHTLTIEPGVDVLFDADRAFVVLGQLNAQGTKQDPISFRPGVAPEWGGIRITGANQVNTLKYLYITGGNADNNAHGGTGGGTDGGGIYTNKTVYLENCSILKCKSLNSGGGSFGCRITKCLISNNRSTLWDGGGTYSTIAMDSIIENNTAGYMTGAAGGGCYGGNTTNCDIRGNRITGNGAGGAGTKYTTATNCKIYNNWAQFDGSCSNAGTLTNCTIFNNTHGRNGSIFYSTLYNCTIYNNTRNGIQDNIYTSSQLIKNVICWPSGYSAASGYTTYSDIGGSGIVPGSGNINSDPLFTDPANGDFTLQSGSPCVGAGESGVNMGISGIVGLTVPESEVGCPDPSPRHLIDPYPQLPYQPPRVNIIIPKHEVTNEAEIGGQNTGEPYNITSNLIGWWKLDGNALDSSSYKNNGTIYGAIPTTDRFNAANKAMYFDGINDYIGGSNLALDRRDFTLCLWAKAAATISTGRYFFGGGTTNGTNLRLHVGYRNSTQITLAFYSNDINWTFTGLVTPTQWNHYAFVHTNKGTSTLYINGRAISTQAHTGEYVGTSAYVIGGNVMGSIWWYGSIDNVRVYYEAKTAKDISDIYSCDNVDLLVGSPKELKKKETIILASHELFVPEPPTKEIIIPRQELYIPETNMDILPQSNRSIEPIEVDKQEEPEIQTEYEQYENEQVKPKLSEIESIIEVTEKYFDYWYVRDATAEDIEVPDWTTPPDDFTIIEGTPVSFTIEATNNPVYTVTGLPAGATIDSATGQFTWTPSSGDILASTTYTGVFRATNAAGYTEATVDISEYNITSGLVGWWKLNGNALDSSPYGNNGTIAGPVVSGDRFGRVSGAMYFDGVNDQITCSGYSLKVSGSMSASLWTRFDTGAARDWVALFTKPAYTGDYGLMIYWWGNPKHIRYYHKGTTPNTTTYVFPTSINNGQWYHFVVTYDGTSTKIYSYGNLVLTSGVTGNIATSNEILRIGMSNPTSYPYKGIIQDFRIYNRALSSGEITQLYHYIGS